LLVQEPLRSLGDRQELGASGRHGECDPVVRPVPTSNLIEALGHRHIHANSGRTQPNTEARDAAVDAVTS
jgi:hypothetical protein